LQLRLPATLAQDLYLAAGCSLTLDRVPLWRRDAIAQVSGWVAADIAGIECPAPRVIGAVAVTSTTVEVAFDRSIDAASVSPDGSQFALSGGLTVTSSVASGKTVTLTTSPQTGGAAYTVVVASSVTDTYGSGVDPATNSAGFTGSGSP
jgi:hypothetical protein